MTSQHLNDLTRKAMIREYMQLRQNTVNLIEASNAIITFLEDNYVLSEELQDLCDSFDRVVDQTKI